MDVLPGTYRDEVVPITKPRHRYASDPPLPIWLKFAFGMASFPRNSMASVVNVYFLLFLLNVAQLPAGYASIITLVGRVLDACSDPLLGFVITRTRTRFGKYRPWILGSLLFSYGFYILLWYVPDFSPKQLLVYYVFVYWLYYASQTCFGIPYLSLTLNMTNSQKEFDSLTAYRMACEVIGIIFGIGMHALFIFIYKADADPCTDDNLASLSALTAYVLAQKKAYFASAVFLGLFQVIFGVILFFSASEVYVGAGETFSSTVRHYKQIIKFRPFQYLASCFFFITIGYSFLTTTYGLFYRWVLHAFGIFPLTILLMYIVAAISIPAWQHVLPKIGKKTALTLNLLPFMLFLWLHLYLKYNIYLFLALAVVAGILIGSAKLSPQSMIPDTIGAFAIEYGHGKEPLFFVVMEFFDKLGVGVCSALSTFILELYGYVTGACVQPPAVSTALRIILGGLPIVCFLIGLIFLWEYPITERHRRLMSDRIKKSMSDHVLKYSQSQSMLVEERSERAPLLRSKSVPAQVSFENFSDNDDDVFIDH